MEQTSKKMLLVIEDDLNLREILVKKFTVEGFNVVEAANGQEGLEKFTANAVDAILLDLYMPVMDGNTFLDKLREMPNGKTVPVVVLSNMVGHDFVVEVFDKKIADYLIKANSKLELIVEKVKSAMEKK